MATNDWVTVIGPSSGSGSGAVAFRVAPNNTAQREGTIAVAGQIFTITQASPSNANCRYEIAPSSASVGAAGGSGTVRVNVLDGCGWMATSNAPWVAITAGASGNGGGTVTFVVAPNTGAARSAMLTIAGQTFTLNQAGT